MNPKLLKNSRGGNPLENFSLSLQNQKKSDLSHLGDLSDILRGHFDEKNNWGTTLPGVRVSRQRPVEKVIAWNLLCMLEMSFPPFIS